uniref:Uncharacterized protein n=1 Tax=Arundo donax TaxID=35708 RepID=A0A0A9CCD2_ARUDO
MSKPLRAVTSS